MKDKFPFPTRPFVLHRAYEGQISRSNGAFCPSFRTNLMLLVYVYLIVFMRMEKALKLVVFKQI